MDYTFLIGMPGGPELIIILVVILLLFGSTRLPQLARGMGKSISEFKKGIAEGEQHDDERELAEKRREQLRDSETAREDELASADAKVRQK
jgi:sec-independent protein translocase protein TatA